MLQICHEFYLNQVLYHGGNKQFYNKAFLQPNDARYEQLENLLIELRIELKKYL
jgi:hypothetical protein